MEPTILEIAYIAGGFGIAGVLIGGLATHFLSKDISMRHAFNQAAKELIAAFQYELTRLKLEPTTTHDIINPSRIKHGEACAVFSKHLSGRELERFISAWKIYYISTPPCPADNEDSQQYQDERTALIERIETLLDFAKFK